MRTSILCLLFTLSMTEMARQSYDKYFTDKVLRFDFMFSGNSKKTMVYPVGLKEVPTMSEPLNLGLSD